MHINSRPALSGIMVRCDKSCLPLLMKRVLAHPAVLAALAAAALFGASTPLAKQLLGDLPALTLAGLLYLGSGLGLLMLRVLRDRGWTLPALSRIDWFWLGGAIFFGGVVGPVLLMWGLMRTSAATASLLLNLEAVLTALLAWIVFHENTNSRVMLGMLAIVAGGAVLSLSPGAGGTQSLIGPLAIAGACLSWAIDNNLTRKVSAADALFIAGIKGLTAGLFNTLLATLVSPALPAAQTIMLAMLLGFFGYGVSLVMFVLALRGLGAARAGAYFSTAPFLGAALAVVVFGEATSPLFWLAAALMILGVWLHLTESHAHTHTHEVLEHTHRHMHDEHHQHAHEAMVPEEEPHTHRHVHAPIRHSHPHFPDVHHRHSH